MSYLVSAAVARFAALLQAVTGAALVGWNTAAAYAANTIGWAIRRAGVTPYHFGAVGDGVADDTAALQAWAAYTGGPRVGAPGRFKVAGTIDLGTSPDIDFRGMVIDAGAWAAAPAGASVVVTSGAALTALPALNASPAAGDTSLSFSAAHGLAENDVAIIYNPTNGSFNAARTYYRAGEYVQALAITSATGVKLWGGLYAGYASGAVTVYKMATHRVALRNLTVIAPSAAASIRPLRVSLATRLRLENVNAWGSNYVGLDLDRCFDVEIRGADLYEQPQVYSDEYGISIGNCQNVKVFGGQLSASRHAVSIGGDDVVGCVPCRNVRVIGATLRNDPATSAPAADIHGNAEDVEYIGCTIYGGGSFGGLDNAYRDCVFNGAPVANGALIVGGSECMGGRYVVEGCHLKASGAYSVGVVRGYNGAAATVKDSTLVVKNCTVEMATCDTFARFDMGTAAFKANADVQGITFLSAGSLANVCRMVGTGAAGDGDFVIVDGITNAKAGAALYIAASGYGAAVKCRLMRQDGTASVVLTSAAPVSSVTPSFRLSYGSKVPKLQGLALDTRVVGANPLGVAYRLKNAGAVTIDVFTTNNANAGATPTVGIDYAVGLSEI